MSSMMSFLYATKGCAHCDSREYCPKQLKNSDVNLSQKPRIIKKEGKEWTSYCEDFYREARE